jgi:DNA-binding transcriptional LysR family regulator
MAGLGIAFISAHTIAAEIDDGRLAILDRPARDPAVVHGASSNETNDAGGQQFA